MKVSPPARVLVYAFSGLLLLLAGPVWLVSTQVGLEWAARGIEAASAGRVSIGDPRGSLLGPLHIGRLEVQTDTWRIIVRNLALDWRPAVLWQRRLELTRVQADELAITQLRPDTAPPRLPETLALPIRLSLPRVRVEHLSLGRKGKKISLTGLRLSLVKPSGRYRLDLQSLDTPWGRIQGRAELADQRPFELEATAELDRPGRYRAMTKVDGDLSRIRLRVEASRPANLSARAVLTPFSASALESAQVQASGVDPRHWDPTWPRARLDARADLTLTGGRRLAGSLKVENGLSGPLDRERLPLVHLSGRFEGTPEDLSVTDLVLDLGRGGRLDGQGSWRANRFQVELKTADLDPGALHSALHPLRLAGSLSLSGDAAFQRLQARLAHGRYELALDATRHGDELSVATARLATGGGRLEVSGRFGLNSPHDFKLTGQLASFDPARLGAFPEADLNARLQADGRLGPRPFGRLEFTLGPSRFRNQPLTGGGRLTLTPGRLADSDLRLALAGNRLTVHGAFGHPGDRLAWQVEADRLALLDPRLAGRLDAGGTLSGSPGAPVGRFRASARDLAWDRAFRLQRLEASGRLEDGADGPLELTADLKGLHGGGLTLDQARFHGRGTRSHHRLEATLQGGDLDARVVLAGGWSDRRGWKGEIETLENRGRDTLRLRAPARLELARGRVALADATLDYGKARIALQALDWQPGRVSSRGSFTHLRPIRLAARLGLAGGWGGDLELGGRWDFRADAAVDGTIALWRQAGDLRAPTEPATDLGLEGLNLELSATDDRLEGRLNAKGKTLGTLTARVASRLTKRSGSWGLAGNAPVSGEAAFRLPTLAWLGPLLDRRSRLSLEGTASAKLDLSGTAASPQLAGELAGEKLGLSWPEVGIQFRDGSLLASLEGDTLRLRRFVVKGGKGSLSATGTAAWRRNEPVLDLKLTAEGLEALARPDRQLVLSGTGQVVATGRKVRLQGRLKAERALIVLPRETAPTRSEDVVVVGRPETAEKNAPLGLAVDLVLDLGDHFSLKGRGLDARLTGRLKVQAEPHARPRVTGSVRVAQGSYTAYGQRLAIERGILDFRGRLDNPALDILAMRQHQTVEAGVAVTGTALAPRVRLVSRPEVPDTEKLSWLVLGRGTDTATSADMSILASAASALLSAGQSVTLQARIARATGLSEVGLKGGGELQNTVLALGKRLSSRAYLSYEQGLAGVGSLVKLNYSLSHRWSVQAQTGRENAVDLFFTLSFD